MSDNDLLNVPAGNTPLVLPNIPPFVWPEPRMHAGGANYETMPPFEKLMADADLIAGTLVGVTDNTVCWLETIMAQPPPRKVKLIVVAYPAGPTREEHLLRLQKLQGQFIGPKKEIDVRLFPFNRVYGNDYEQMALMPTILQATSVDGKTMFCIGSTGDAGWDAVNPASFNIIFQPDDALRDSWRRWFEYLFSSSARLTPESVRIPHLIPATGDSAAAEKWEAYKRACLNRGKEQRPRPTVEPNTGETTEDGDGMTVDPWDGGRTKLDPLAQRLVQVYAQGHLVTIDDSAWINPLDIPVKAALLLWQPEQSVRTVKHKRAFNLQVLDEATAKHLEECCSVSDLKELSYRLSEGTHWISEKAKNLLEKELESRNLKGQAIIRQAMNGNNEDEFLSQNNDSIRHKLNEMYYFLNLGTSVPEKNFDIIIDEVRKRLKAARNMRIIPKAIYNKIAPPDLTINAPVENWRQPLSLLLQSAEHLRKSLMKDSCSSWPIAEMDIFDDMIVQTGTRQKAQDELSKLKEIEDKAATLNYGPKEKCDEVWKIIRGKKGT